MDPNPAYVDAVNQGRAPVQEPGLAEMIGGNRGPLRATLGYKEAVAATASATFPTA